MAQSLLDRMLGRTPKMLVDMEFDEMSGVDHPANEEEGWVELLKQVGDDEVSFALDLLKAGFNLDEIDYEEVVKVSVPTHTPPKLDDSTWDGAAARKALKARATGVDGKIDFNKYAQGFAIVDGPADEIGSYKFPHHTVRDGKLVTSKAGVTAAWGAAMGARTGVANAAAARHLKPHRKQFGMGEKSKEDVMGDKNDLDLAAMEKQLKAEEEKLDKQAELFKALSAIDIEGMPEALKPAVTALLEYAKAEGGVEEPESAEKAVKPGYNRKLIGMLMTLVRTLTPSKKSEAEEDEALGKALTEAWPAFVEQVSTVLTSSDDISTKRASLAKAVEVLGDDVKAKIAA